MSSQNSLANENCKLFNNSDVPNISQSKVYSFEKKTLVCTEELKTGSTVNDYTIIRSHINEAKSVEVLASSHGYHLINDTIDCNKTHCEHINFIDLHDFNSIQKVQTKEQSFKGDFLIQQLVDKIDSSLWLADIVTLSSWSRSSGSTDNNNAMAWIKNKMLALNLQVTTPAFNTTHNIIGIQLGLDRLDDWYIVGAHMDSRPFSGSAPGAVDNASGCAGVLEIARIASEYSFEGSIIFICYSGEEQGLLGSINHVNTIINDGDQSKVKAALTMDMVGYTSNSNQHELLLESSSTNQWLIDLMALNAATYAPNLTIFTSTNPFGSDHVPYINNNMPGILSIDDNWDIYPDYHQSTDLPENINLTQGEYILKTNLSSLAQLATLKGLADLIFTNGFE